jgi:hypothetical protein|uniref:Eukaryotic translation initiation factor 4E n=1 Tax=viral metagenome TaxID=1070528 RepID=A0A6C0F135_9ZZZZ
MADIDTQSQVFIMESEKSMSQDSSIESNNFHKLSDTWILWAHLPHDTDWSIKSYIKICSFTTVEETISIINVLPPKLVTNCMLFLMRDGISPTWEDARNRKGGCFSYKISNKDVPQAWKELTYVLVGESMSDNKNFIPLINGITISPKKNFCIVKVWLASCEFRDASIIKELYAISPHGCLFKEHMPEY